MKRDDTRKNLTPLSGNDLKTVPLHYPSFPCIIAIVTISEVFCFMRYHSVLNAELHLFCSENRNFCIIIIFLVFSCSLQKGRLPREVNPFVGTGFHGHTYPIGTLVPAIITAIRLSRVFRIRISAEPDVSISEISSFIRQVGHCLRNRVGTGFRRFPFPIGRNGHLQAIIK